MRCPESVRQVALGDQAGGACVARPGEDRDLFKRRGREIFGRLAPCLSNHIAQYIVELANHVGPHPKSGVGRCQTGPVQYRTGQRPKILRFHERVRLRNELRKTLEIRDGEPFLCKA